MVVLGARDFRAAQAAATVYLDYVTNNLRKVTLKC